MAEHFRLLALVAHGFEATRHRATAPHGDPPGLAGTMTIQQSITTHGRAQIHPLRFIHRAWSQIYHRLFAKSGATSFLVNSCAVAK
jgi:hypothetical protein